MKISPPKFNDLFPGLEKKQSDFREFFHNKVISSWWLPNFFKTDRNSIMLNLGCGYGPQVYVFHQHVSKIVAIDINEKRLIALRQIAGELGITNCIVIKGDCNFLPFKLQSFNYIIGIDLIEHVDKPDIVLQEVYRVSKKKGEVLITFPVMYDVYRKFIRITGTIIRFIVRKARKKFVAKPDQHNYIAFPNRWLRLFSKNGYKIQKTKATTMFPPLHLLGIPRFWYTNRFIHRVDYFISSLPLIKFLGITIVLLASKKEYERF